MSLSFYLSVCKSKIYGLHGLEHHTVDTEINGDVTLGDIHTDM